MMTANDTTGEAPAPTPVQSDIVGGSPEALSVALSQFIHVARWIAATMVLVYHVSATFVSVPDIMTAPHNPLVYVWWFFTPFIFAHEAVVVFFVLSGFLVGGAVLERRKQEAPWLRKYLIDRIVRIYVVFLPVIALTLVLDASGQRLFEAADLYDLPFLDGHYDIGLIFPNVLSLQGLWFEPLGTNIPLWSLGMEVWFYILFPLLLLPWLRAYPRHWPRVFGLAAAIVFLLSLPTSNYTPFGFAIWSLGAIVRVMPRPLLRSKWLSLSLFVVVSVVLRFAVREHLMKAPPIEYFVDAIEALLFGNVLLTLRFDRGEGFRFARSKLHAKLASFSFTLYAFHVPVVFWIAGAVGLVFGASWRSNHATPLHYAVAIAVVVFTLVAAYGLSLLTEAHTETVRRWARGLLRGAQSGVGLGSCQRMSGPIPLHRGCRTPSWLSRSWSSPAP